MKVKVYKLLSGRDIIGRVVEEGIGWVILENVHVFEVIPQEGGYSLRMVHFSPLMPEAPWKYFTQQFLGELTEVPADLEGAYVQQTSKIEIVSGMGALGK